MLKKSLLILIAVAILCGSLYYVLFLNGRQTLYQITPNAKNISQQFKIDSQPTYSLSDQKIIVPATEGVPGIGEMIEVKVNYLNDYTQPLWGKDDDCNFDGVLEKKELTGWTAYDYTPCKHVDGVLYKPDTFYGNGVGDLTFYVYTDPASNPTSIVMHSPLDYIRRLIKNSEKTTGTYRIVREFYSGCKADKKDCTENLYSISPEFKIVR
jgi:hypothetical protein